MSKSETGAKTEHSQGIAHPFNGLKRISTQATTSFLSSSVSPNRTKQFLDLLGCSSMNSTFHLNGMPSPDRNICYFGPPHQRQTGQEFRPHETVQQSSGIIETFKVSTLRCPALHVREIVWGKHILNHHQHVFIQVAHASNDGFPSFFRSRWRHIDR
jgi:hypothetical protein